MKGFAAFCIIDNRVEKMLEITVILLQRANIFPIIIIFVPQSEDIKICSR